jgi:hypothetical protein
VEVLISLYSRAYARRWTMGSSACMPAFKCWIFIPGFSSGFSVEQRRVLSTRAHDHSSVGVSIQLPRGSTSQQQNRPLLGLQYSQSPLPRWRISHNPIVCPARLETITWSAAERSDQL